MRRTASRVYTALLWAFSIAAIPAGWLGCTSNDAAPPAETEERAGALEDQATCVADPQWLESPSMPDDVPVHPSNCDFHAFAWRSFLHLAQPSGDAPDSPLNFEAFMPAQGALVAEGEPVAYGKTPPSSCAVRSPRERVLKKRLVGSQAHFSVALSNDLQATDDVLVDQAQRVIYYEQLINEVEYGFITSCQLYQKGCFEAANNLPDPSSVHFPPGSIEMKTAWRILPAPDPSYYTVTGLVEAESGRCSRVTAALVGFHIVVRTVNHPEFIWATFEHRKNGPDCDDPEAPPPGGWTFHDPSCSEADCPKNQPTAPPKPAQVCRVNPQGGGTPENQQNIKALNQSIRDLMPTGSVWRNYELVGTLWTLDPQGDKGVIPPIEARQGGSLGASNLAMESFFQGPKAATETDGTCTDCKNCFSCHSFSGGSPIKISNLMEQIAQDGGCADGKMPSTCPAPAAQP